jgi:antitoxin component YwqK of YwqJK toxin-antitoxin module
MRLTGLILLTALVGLGVRAAGGGPTELSGARTTNWPNGSPREEATYSDGLRDGLCQRWHADGKDRAKGLYQDGQMVDEWRFYDQDGVLDHSRSGIYEAGKRVSPLSL